MEQQTGSQEIFGRATAVEGVDAKVRALADLARRYAGSLLQARTADLRQLEILSDRALRERQAADATPAPRGTIAQIMEACRRPLPIVLSGHADPMTPCIYYAVTVDDYSTDEVAAALGISKAAVEQKIADHDTLKILEGKPPPR